MITTFQQCSQRRAQNRFPMSARALTRCATTASSAGCAQDLRAVSLASTAASGMDREDEIMRRAMAEVDAPQSARGRAGHRGECNCTACRERRRLRKTNGK